MRRFHLGTRVSRRGPSGSGPLPLTNGEAHIFTMKLLIVDDHPVLREGLSALLRQWGPDTHVLQARDAHEAFDLLDRHDDLDVVVLDLLMPGLGGLAALAEFGRRRPAL